MTIGFTVVFFFVAPRLIPVVLPSLQESSSYTIVTDQVTTRVQREATPSDVRRRLMEIREYERVRAAAGESRSPEASEIMGQAPEPLSLGAPVFDTLVTGGNRFTGRVGWSPCRAPGW